MVCCVGVAYVFRDFQSEWSDDPVRVEAAGKEMATVRIPPGFHPVFLVGMANIRIVAYMSPAIDGRLIIGTGLAGSDQHFEIGQIAAARTDKKAFFSDSLLDEKNSSKQIRIKHTNCNCEFTQGLDCSGHKMRRRVQGTFAGNRGPTVIELEMDDSAYHEAEIIRMLEGIR
jgi:hypothetical protein